MNKTQIQTLVRSALKDQIAANPDVIDLINESRLAFEGMSANIILENAAVNPAIVKNIDNLKSMYLERGAEKVMLFSNGRVHESLNLNTEERKQFRNYNEVRSYAEELKQEGFKPVKNKGAIARFLAKSVRKIASYIRKYGLITIVGIGIAAALIYFVGPMAVPFLGQIAARLGLSGIMGGGEAVEVSGTGWVSSTPMLGSLSDDAVSSMTDEISKLDNDIAALPDIIASTAKSDPETAANLSNELQNAISQREYVQSTLDTNDSINMTRDALAAQSDQAVADLAATTTAANIASLEKAMDTYRDLINDPTISPEVRQNMSDALQKLVAQRNALR